MRCLKNARGVRRTSKSRGGEETRGPKRLDDLSTPAPDALIKKARARLHRIERELRRVDASLFKVSRHLAEGKAAPDAGQVVKLTNKAGKKFTYHLPSLNRLQTHWHKQLREVQRELRDLGEWARGGAPAAPSAADSGGGSDPRLAHFYGTQAAPETAPGNGDVVSGP